MLRLRSFRRLVTLALPCWLVGGPLATTLQSVATCPHEAMPSSMHHSPGSQVPCWCPDMSGAAAVEPPTLPVATVEHAATGIAAPVVTVVPQLQSVAVPSSPSFAPTPPPPNGRV